MTSLLQHVSITLIHLAQCRTHITCNENPHSKVHSAMATTATRSFIHKLGSCANVVAARNEKIKQEMYHTSLQFSQAVFMALCISELYYVQRSTRCDVDSMALLRSTCMRLLSPPSRYRTPPTHAVVVHTRCTYTLHISHTTALHPGRCVHGSVYVGTAVLTTQHPL